MYLIIYIREKNCFLEIPEKFFGFFVFILIQKTDLLKRRPVWLIAVFFHFSGSILEGTGRKWKEIYHCAEKTRDFSREMNRRSSFLRCIQALNSAPTAGTSLQDS